jgi:hypothetical protein
MGNNTKLIQPSKVYFKNRGRTAGLSSSKKLIPVIESVLCAILLVGCRPSYERYGSAGYFDAIMALKSSASEVVSVRREGGMLELIACNVSQFPVSTEAYFKSPPSRMFTLPVPLSCEEKKVFLKWRSTPVDARHLHSVMSLVSMVESIGLEKGYVAKLNSLINSTNGYYAMSFERLGSNAIYNVTLYVMDPSSRRLYYLTDTNDSL